MQVRKQKNVAYIKGETQKTTNEDGSLLLNKFMEWDLPGHQISTIDCVILLPTGDAGRVVNLVKIE